MSQAIIDAFVGSARKGTLTPEKVMTAVLTRGIAVNERDSSWGETALHWAVHNKRHELVVALLAAGADANVKDNDGRTSVWWGALNSTAGILQLLMDDGGSANEPENDGWTPLIMLVSNNVGDAAARLGVLLALPELEIDVKGGGKTAEEWALEGSPELATAIADEVGLLSFARPMFCFLSCGYHVRSCLGHFRPHVIICLPRSRC